MLHSGGRPQDLELPVKNRTKDYMIQKVKKKKDTKRTQTRTDTQIKANLVCYMS